jgi:hypothetical protein
MNMSFKLKSYVFLLMLVTLSESNAQTYLCAADKATGFKNNRGEWVESHFTTNEKYILKWNNSHWSWIRVGEKFGGMCNAKNEEVFSCDMSFEHLIFNKRLMRFIYSNPGGYALEALKSDTPYMAIGKCSPI